MPQPAAPLAGIVLTLMLAAASCSLVGGDDDGDDGATPLSLGSSQNDGADDADRADEADGGGAGTGQFAGTNPGGDPTAIDPTFTAGDCHFELPLDTTPQCGTVTVPMDWDTGDGEVHLAVAIFAGTADTAAADDPVVYLEGGPGGHALETLQYSTADLLEPLLARGDVVVFDQRGVGLSEPRLDCEELTELNRAIEDIAQIERDEEDARFFAALTACSERLSSEGIDLDQFHTVNNAHDVEAIRLALGYDQWNLYGISYGTRLGLEVIRQHPDGVRSAVLDSVYPPQVDSVLENPTTFLDSYDAIVDACNQDVACAGGGDLGARLRAVAQTLDAEPVQIEVQDYLTGETDEIYADGETLVGIINQALYTPWRFTDLPELVAELEDGQTRALAEFLSQDRTLERYFSPGMFYAVECNEEIPFADPEAVAAAVPPDPFGLLDSYEYASNTGAYAFRTCEAFGSGTPPPGSNEAVTSDIPTLLMAGEYDPVTPVAWATDAAATLPNSFLVVAPSESHGVSPGQCGMGIVGQFLDDPTAEPDASCLDEPSWQFISAPEPDGGIELEDAEFEVPGAGGTMTVSVVRPAEWEHGRLPGDSYRSASFLDQTQIVQIAADNLLATALEQYLLDAWDVELSAPTDRSVGGRDWRCLVGTGEGVAVQWYETEINDQQVIVLLVSDPAELDYHIDAVLRPALEAIDVQEVAAA